MRDQKQAGGVLWLCKKVVCVADGASGRRHGRRVGAGLQAARERADVHIGLRQQQPETFCGQHLVFDAAGGRNGIARHHAVAGVACQHIAVLAVLQPDGKQLLVACGRCIKTIYASQCPVGGKAMPGSGLRQRLGAQPGNGACPDGIAQAGGQCAAALQRGAGAAQPGPGADAGGVTLRQRMQQGIAHLGQLMHMPVPADEGWRTLHPGFERIELAYHFSGQPVRIKPLQIAGGNQALAVVFAVWQRVRQAHFRQIQMQPHIHPLRRQGAQGGGAFGPAGAIYHAGRGAQASALGQIQHGGIDACMQAKVVCAHAHAALPHGHGNASACVIGGRRHGSFTKVGQRQIHILWIVPCSLILLAWGVAPELAKKAA